MVSNVWTKGAIGFALLILIGAALWTTMQNTNSEQTTTQTESVVNWIKALDRNQPKETQTATFSLG
jgi:predicted negative regulator of RcsB-dependent stress response